MSAKKIGIAIASLLCFLVVVYLVAPIAIISLHDFHNGSWERYSGNPVLTVGGVGAWDDYWAAFTSMVKVGSTYYGYYNGLQNVPLSCQVGLATSTDGITWAKAGSNPVLTGGTVGQWDYHNAGMANVWVEGSTFYMIYTSMSATTNIWGIGLATSPDGINWTKYAGNPVYVPNASGWDGHFLETGSVLKEGSTYYLYYSGNSVYAITDTCAIGVLTSTDLHTWTPSPSNPIMTCGNHALWDTALLAPCSVYKLDATYYMWYEGAPYQGGSYNLSEIGLAISTSPISGWARDINNPVLHRTEKAGNWDSNWTEVGVVINFGNEWRMYYTGSTAVGTPHAQSGFATFIGSGNIADVFGTGFIYKSILHHNVPSCIRYGYVNYLDNIKGLLESP